MKSQIGFHHHGILTAPLVSVGLQYYNNEQTLGRAIQSIINQTYQNWELILHNDGSTDDSYRVAQCFSDSRIRLYTDSVNKGRPERLNESIHLANGKYYAVMDGDDIAYPQRLSKQVAYLEAHPDVNLLGANMLIFDGMGITLGKRQLPSNHEIICWHPWSGFPMAQPTFMGQTAWFIRYLYDPRAHGGTEDQDLLLRSYKGSRFANHPDILMGYCESRLSLRKIIRARYFMCHNMTRTFMSQRQWVWVARAVAGQILRSVVDIPALITGLDYTLLRHRARYISFEEKQTWSCVYDNLMLSRPTWRIQS